MVRSFWNLFSGAIGEMLLVICTLTTLEVTTDTILSSERYLKNKITKSFFPGCVSFDYQRLSDEIAGAYRIVASDWAIWSRDLGQTMAANKWKTPFCFARVCDRICVLAVIFSSRIVLRLRTVFTVRVNPLELLWPSEEKTLFWNHTWPTKGEPCSFSCAPPRKEMALNTR